MNSRKRLVRRLACLILLSPMAQAGCQGRNAFVPSAFEDRKAISISNDGQAICALLEGGEIWCVTYWSSDGMSGDGLHEGQIDTAVRLIPGSGYCAIRADGVASCFDDLPQAGDVSQASCDSGNTFLCCYVSKGASACWPGTDAIVDVAGVAGAGCAVLATGEVQCASGPAESPEIVTIEGISGARRVTVAGGGAAFYGCALVGDQVKCWGANSDGQLGDGTTEDSESAVTVIDQDNDGEPLTGVTSVQVGDAHGCALTKDGKVHCWGRADYGNDLGAVTVGDVDNAVQIAVGGIFDCALRSDGEVLCWQEDDLPKASSGGCFSVGAGQR